MARIFTKKLSFSVMLGVALISIITSNTYCQQKVNPDIIGTVIAISKYPDSTRTLQPHGTGFLIWNYEKDSPSILVTNRHIFLTRDSLGKEISRENIIVETNIVKPLKDLLKVNRASFIFNVPLKRGDTLLWTAHPHKNVDIAVTYFPPSDSIHISMFRSAQVKIIPRSACLLFEDVELVQFVIFVGFPLGIGREGEPTPVIRSGMVSYKKGDKSFLIDGQVFGGSSGSPVFSLPSYDSTGKYIKGTQRLLGIISGHRISPLQNIVFSDVESGVDTLPVENAGLGVVFSTDLILETIDEHLNRKLPTVQIEK